MDKLHQSLMDKYDSYRSWHERKGSQAAQWFLLALIVIVVASLVINRVRKQDSVSYGLQSLASSQHQEEKFEQLPQLTRELLNYANELKGLTPAGKAQLLSKMHDVARRRHALLMAAAQSDPGVVVRNAMPQNLLAQFPAELKDSLEQSVIWQGKLTTEEQELFQTNGNFASGKTIYNLNGANPSEKVTVLFEHQPENITSGSQVQLSGVLLESYLIVSADPTSAQVLSTFPAEPLTQKKVAVILYNFENYAQQTAPAADMRMAVFTGGVTSQGVTIKSANDFYQEVSLGKVGLTGALRADGDVFGWYTIPNSVVAYPADASVCGAVGTAAAASMAQADGFVAANYDKFIYVFPNSACPYSGSTAGNTVKIDFPYLPTIHLLSHELGHTFGLDHANQYNCTNSSGQRVSISTTCTSQEYSDFYDVMGNGGTRHFSNFRKGFLNWLDPGNTQTVSALGDYTIVPAEPASTGIKSLRILRTSGQYYYLEFRQNYGFDSWNDTHKVLSGVLIRLAPDYSNGGAKTNLIDTTPETTSVGVDEALQSGQTFSDSSYGVSFTVQSVSASGAVVHVSSFNQPSCVRGTPTLSITPSSQAGEPGQTLGYKVTLKNNDNDDCTAATYTVNSSLPAGWSQTPTSFTETLSPRQSATRDFSVTSAATAAVGNYTLTMKMGSGKSAITATSVYVVSVTDTVPPTVSIVKPIDNTVVGTGKNLTITANASDNVKVASIKVFFDNNQIANCASVTICSYSYPIKSITTGSHTITASAQDFAGNTANASPVTITK